MGASAERELRELGEPKLKPVCAYGAFVLNPSGIDQTVLYVYVDETAYYWSLLELGDETKISEEKKLLAEGMRSVLSEEVVMLNGKRLEPVVAGVSLLAPLPNTALVAFSIRYPARLVRGVNTYQNYYEEVVAEYDYCATWYLPASAKLVKANFGVPVDVLEGNVLSFRVRRGTKVPGYEEIEFVLP